MKTTINGKPIMQAVAEQVLRKIIEANPAIAAGKYETMDAVPGFKETMEQPRFLSFSQEDPEAYQQLLRKLNRTQKLHKKATIDCRRKEDGTETVAAVFNGRDLWEVAIGWDVLIDRRPQQQPVSGDLSGE